MKIGLKLSHCAYISAVLITFKETGAFCLGRCSPAWMEGVETLSRPGNQEIMNVLVGFVVVLHD
ncbi:MAG: hypothetical protein ACYC0O_05085 [Desulfurivibrionaceae bacterium]